MMRNQVPQAHAGQAVAYVSLIDEGKVLMLPRPSLNTAGLVPLFSAPPSSLLEQAGKALEKCQKWMDDHGETVFFGGGMAAINPMNEANSEALAALAALREALKGQQ